MSKPRWQIWVESHPHAVNESECVNVPIYALSNLVLARDGAEEWIKKQQAALVESAKEKKKLLDEIEELRNIYDFGFTCTPKWMEDVAREFAMADETTTDQNIEKHIKWGVEILKKYVPTK